jgi:hypothetical protein
MTLGEDNAVDSMDACNATDAPILCPVAHAPAEDFVACDGRELDALIGWLVARREMRGGRLEFPRGVIEAGRLDLCKQDLGPEGARRILRALEGHGGIRSVLLGTNALRDEGAGPVGAAMRRNPALETVYLGCNGITAAGLEPLCTAIEDGAATAALWLKRNPIGLRGAERLAQMLQRAHSLRTLDLVNTGLGDEGAGRVLRAIRAAPQGLERLYLGGNGLTMASAAVAAELLAANARIVALYLGTNHLRDAGAAALAEGVRENRTLRELSLPANGLSAAGARALCMALRGHPALQLLDFGTTRSAKKLGAPENAIDGGAVAAPAELVALAPELRVLNLRGNALDSAAVLRIIEAGEGRARRCAIHVEGNPCNRRTRKRAVALAEGAEPLVGREDVAAIRSGVR